MELFLVMLNNTNYTFSWTLSLDIIVYESSN